MTPNEFKEELFTFVHKIVPNIKYSMFQFVQVQRGNQSCNSWILLPKNDYYIKWIDYRGSNSYYDYYSHRPVYMYSDYDKRSFYTLCIANDGFYEVIRLTQTKPKLYYIDNKISTEIKSDIIENVSCREFYNNFNTIKCDLSLLLKDEPVVVKPPEISAEEYCTRGISLMKKI